MYKCCGTCKHVICDSVPWGMGSTSYVSGCKIDDKIALELSEEELEKIDNGERECPYWEACRE